MKDLTVVQKRAGKINPWPSREFWNKLQSFSSLLIDS